MKVAICGYPPLAFQLSEQLKNNGIECTHFIKDFVSDRSEKNFSMPSLTVPPIFINFFEFRKFIATEKLDGLIIAEEGLFQFSKELMKVCKFYSIPNVGIINFWNPGESIYWLDSDKAFIPYMESNLIDSCNLNCKGCTHFANLFNDNDFYALEDFKRDLRRVSETTDVLRLRLMGGEPLLLKNLDQYIKIARKYLPKTALRLVTNGLLIPSTPQYILDALRENKFVVDISMYKPTLKIMDKIVSILQTNKIMFQKITGDIETFDVYLTLRSGHNMSKVLVNCNSKYCRFIRNGKIYKCPLDALSFKFAERFNVKNFPNSVGVDIFSSNYTANLEKLDGAVELCGWCSETFRKIDWKPENHPKITDWLVNPDEVENLLPK